MSGTTVHCMHYHMLIYCLKFLVLAVSTLGVDNHLRNAENKIGTDICFAHDECQATKFCAWSTCIYTDGRNLSCGVCKPCSSCLCDTNSIDSACPRNRCPAQPSEGVRYLQGVFLGDTQVDNSNYSCARRLIISGGTIHFLQIRVHEGHPATQEVLNISDNFTACPSFVFSGIIVDTDASRDDGAVGLRVADGVHSLPTRLLLRCVIVPAPAIRLITVYLNVQAMQQRCGGCGAPALGRGWFYPSGARHRSRWSPQRAPGPAGAAAWFTSRGMRPRPVQPGRARS